METPKEKPYTNIGSFLKPDQKDHADKVYEFLKADNITALQQIDKLKADKEELLEALELTSSELEGGLKLKEINSMIKSLIQKHKK